MSKEELEAKGLTGRRLQSSASDTDLLDAHLYRVRAKKDHSPSDAEMISIPSDDVCVEFRSQVADPAVTGCYSVYADQYLGKNHFLFVAKSVSGSKIVAVLRAPNLQTRCYDALLFSQYGIFRTTIEMSLVLGTEVDVTSPRDLDIKLLTYFINYGSIGWERLTAGMPAEFCLDSHEDNIAWSIVSTTKTMVKIFFRPHLSFLVVLKDLVSKLPALLLSLEVRLGFRKRLTIGVICNIDCELEEVALKNAVNNGSDPDFLRFCKVCFLLLLFFD